MRISAHSSKNCIICFGYTTAVGFEVVHVANLVEFVFLQLLQTIQEIKHFIVFIYCMNNCKNFTGKGFEFLRSFVYALAISAKWILSTPFFQILIKVPLQNHAQLAVTGFSSDQKLVGNFKFLVPVKKRIRFQTSLLNFKHLSASFHYSLFLDAPWLACIDVCILITEKNKRKRTTKNIYHMKVL